MKPQFDWTPERTQIVRDNWAAHNGREIAAMIGADCTCWIVWSKVAVLDLPRRPHIMRVGPPKPARKNRPQKRPPKIVRFTPTEQEWLEVATQVATERGLRPSLLMGGKIDPAYTAARWAAWRALKDRSPAYTLAGVGRVSGYDHSSLVNAFRQMAVRTSSTPSQNVTGGPNT